MRIFPLAALCVLLAGCDQTTQSGGPSATSPTATANADLPPIYEPLIDMHRVKPDKYRKDVAECRLQAAPQEAAARQARQQQAAGTGLQVAGVVASFIPVSTFSQARNLVNATDAGGAMSADAATTDYALVVNTCLTHKKYRVLRD